MMIKRDRKLVRKVVVLEALLKMKEMEVVTLIWSLR